ncbi:uncharacterized protein RCC_05297 [Ramularia collo-cygni]|uniref:Uncharacterized protein n=1 Tax=Ramularia collo-cygni TaxID=112498 RepID=A0A2D3V7A3_9PEZI|nr:uncharacterized protein RCC_05297 [Ramularia collo-cygni]CZT19446.1 uncharacterized protein RCC_05297 [Ramularia collo-cygni]
MEHVLRLGTRQGFNSSAEVIEQAKQIVWNMFPEVKEQMVRQEKEITALIAAKLEDSKLLDGFDKQVEDLRQGLREKVFREILESRHALAAAKGKADQCSNRIAQLDNTATEAEQMHSATVTELKQELDAGKRQTAFPPNRRAQSAIGRRGKESWRERRPRTGARRCSTTLQGDQNRDQQAREAVGGSGRPSAAEVATKTAGHSLRKESISRVGAELYT